MYPSCITPYITQTLKRPINIIEDDKFAQSNRMLKAMVGMWLSHGGQSKAYIAIENGDLKKITDSYDRLSGESLQNEVLFSLLYFLGARGREELRRLKRADIGFDHDSHGIKYAYIKTTSDAISVPNNIRKNVKASLKSTDYSVNRNS